VIDTRVRSNAYGGARAEAGSAKHPPSWATGIVDGWRRHRDLLDNAGSLLATTGLTSLLGFGFWTVATREFSQQAVGYGSASVSAFTLLGTIGLFGLGTLLIGELPRRGADRAGLVSAAVLACMLGSLLLGLGFAVVAPRVSSHFAVVMGTPARAALFVAGSVLTGVTMIFDQATIGLLRGGLQLTRNVAFAVAKLLVLPGAAIFLHDAFGFGIVSAWVAGMALSLVFIAAWLRLKGTHILNRPRWSILRELGWTAMAHNWLNISLAVPFTLLPVLVTLLVSPSANGAFYIASMLCAFLYVVPISLAEVLFAVVASDPRVIARKLRVALRLSFAIGIPGMIVLGAGAHFLLSIFGRGYSGEATVPLELLVVGYPLAVPKALYIAVCRASGRITRAAVVLTTFSVAELGAATVGALAHGLIGLSLLLLACRFVEALLITPTVVRAAFGHGRHRLPAGTVSEVVSGPQPAPVAGNGYRPQPAAPAGNGYGPQQPVHPAGNGYRPQPAAPARNGYRPQQPAPPAGNGNGYRPQPAAPARNSNRAGGQLRPPDSRAQDYAPAREPRSANLAWNHQHHGSQGATPTAQLSTAAFAQRLDPLPDMPPRSHRGAPESARNEKDKLDSVAERPPSPYSRSPGRSGPPDGRN
jgi:O-antigen/teichoic acid export membrane protein